MATTTNGSACGQYHSPCSPYHSQPPDLGYMQWHWDADRRHKQGEKQIRCPVCGKWVWESYYHNKPSPPKVEHMGGGHYKIVGGNAAAIETD